MTWCLLEPYSPASASNFTVISGKADLLLSSFKAIPCSHGNLLGSSVTMGTWLLGLNTPYHHSIKKYGERGSLVVGETEFRSSPWEMCWGKGCAVGSLESMPHPIWSGLLHERCAGEKDVLWEFRINATPNLSPARMVTHSLCRYYGVCVCVCVCVKLSLHLGYLKNLTGRYLGDFQGLRGNS